MEFKEDKGDSTLTVVCLFIDFHTANKTAKSCLACRKSYGRNKIWWLFTNKYATVYELLVTQIIDYSPSRGAHEVKRLVFMLSKVLIQLNHKSQG